MVCDGLCPLWHIYLHTNDKGGIKWNAKKKSDNTWNDLKGILLFSYSLYLQYF